MNGDRVALIAEFCQNHNGRYDVLARMVEAAARHGATHGKIQAVFAREVTYRPQFEEGLVVAGTVKAIKRPYRPEYERLNGLELSVEEMARFVRLCEDNGIVPMITCFTRAQVGILAELGFRSVKVASYDCASYPMLRELRARFSTVVVSTGASYNDEIRHAARILDGHEFALLHCVTIYPTPLDQMHLARMGFLRELTDRVGFSDHSLVARDGVVASMAAIHLGARVVERHFTILAPEATRDGPVSIGPLELRRLRSFAEMDPSDRQRELDSRHPNWRLAIGERDRRLSDAELLNRDYYRGRFASPRPESGPGTRMIFNWEETPLS
jgi:sialic acid synthase SpsE